MNELQEKARREGTMNVLHDFGGDDVVLRGDDSVEVRRLVELAQAPYEQIVAKLIAAGEVLSNGARKESWKAWRTLLKELGEK